MENRDYLNLSQAEDLKNPREKFLYRFLELIPGILSFATLILMFVLSWLTPKTVAIFIILFDFYWLLKITYLSCHQLSSFIQMKKHLKINWQKKLTTLKNWQKIYHLIILPFFKEEKEIVKDSLESLLKTTYPKEKMWVVLAVEERGGVEALKTSQNLAKEYSEKFGQFLVSVHPPNLPGEKPLKGANVAWAVKMAKEKIIIPQKIPQENILVSIFDIDTKPYPQYFSCLTFHYLTTPRPERASYQPIPVYNNNIWQAPAFSRVVATSGTFWQMMQQARPEALVSYSSHSLPFRVLDEVGYPKNVVSDDSRIFWKSFLFYHGDYRTIPLYYPISMDAVLAKSFFRTIINQYKQQRRWAWGCENIPYLIYGFLKDSKTLNSKQISLWNKLTKSLNILDGFWSWATSSLLIFFLGWLPLILGGEKFNITLLSYNLPRLTGNLMAIAMIGMFISAILSFLLLPPKPKEAGFLKNLSMLLQWFLLPITLIFFGSFPALEAQLRLLLGKYLDFWTTEKVRKCQPS